MRLLLWKGRMGSSSNEICLTIVLRKRRFIPPSIFLLHPALISPPLPAVFVVPLSRSLSTLAALFSLSSDFSDSFVAIFVPFVTCFFPGYFYALFIREQQNAYRDAAEGRIRLAPENRFHRLFPSHHHFQLPIMPSDVLPGTLSLLYCLRLPADPSLSQARLMPPLL